MTARTHVRLGSHTNVEAGDAPAARSRELMGWPGGRREARDRIEPSLGTLRAREGADWQATLRTR